MACKHSSRLPVLIVAAAYNAARNKIGEKIRPLLAHNAADEQTGSLGDVEVCLLDDDNVRTYWKNRIKELGGELVYEANKGDYIINGDGEDWSGVDLAIVDYSFPNSEYTGVDIIAYLKKKGIKEIHLCTGFYEDEAIKIAAINAGANSVIGKS